MSYDYGSWRGGWYAQADEAERKMFREWMQNILKTERVNICFTKADGTERWLHCSLHPDLIPAEKVQHEASTRKRSEEAQSVWDIEKQDWRSFRWDSIKEFSFNLGELHV